jgi:hypothetical protein
MNSTGAPPSAQVLWRLSTSTWLPLQAVARAQRVQYQLRLVVMKEDANAHHYRQFQKNWPGVIFKAGQSEMGARPGLLACRILLGTHPV